MSGGPDIQVSSLITTHQNVDFDAFAATVAAAKLYPDASIVFSGSLNPNVREFVSLHGDALPLVGLKSLDRSTVRRLIVVDTADCTRLGELADLCGRPDVEVIVFDHHQNDASERPAYVQGQNWVVSADGAEASAMVRILCERDIPITPLEATIFALGIHEDTGSLTFPRTTVRDAEMLAACMRLGASQALVERYLHSSLTTAQRALLMRLIDAVRVEAVRGVEVHVVAVVSDEYVDGLSVIAHKLMDILNCEILLQVVQMEERLFVTARSKAGGVDMGALLRTVGGGGHAQAASAVIREGSADGLLQALLDGLAEAQPAGGTAGDIMSSPVRFIDADTPVAEALIVAQQYGHSGISVKEGDRVVGIAARRDLDKAVRHGLGHAPVKGIMTRNVVFARRSASVDELRRLMVETNIGRLPVVADAAYERAVGEGIVRVEDAVGVVTRTDVLAAYQGRDEEEPLPSEVQACPVQPLADLPYLGKIFRTAAALSEDISEVYLVGGFVRDLLLGRPNADVDIAVAGDGIGFARRLARELGGRVRPHLKFKTAVVLFPPEVLGEVPDWLRQGSEPFHIDVATTRTEFYDYPAALPRVEHASIRQDLFRRDFTVNAMAISLKGGEFGMVVDFFGGLRDLQDGVIRVLHNLSFIEDPTRIFRAVRYENRYGFRMDEHTRALARGCVDMHLVGDLSSARLRDELVGLLGERDVDWTLHRLFELGVARQVHPKLATGEKTVALIHRLDGLAREFGRDDEVIPWRLRFAALTRNMAHDELYIWLEKLKLRHADGQIVRSSVVLSPRIEEQLATAAAGDWEVYQLLSSIPLESVVFALAGAEAAAVDIVAARLRYYLEVLRSRRVVLTGADVLALGVRQGPEVGRVLDEVRRLRVEGVVVDREGELAAVRELITAPRASAGHGGRDATGDDA
jgi:tRNA nucleotidyltransferase (CCA-adding enzyme)